jgi:hypothetical protein
MESSETTANVPDEEQSPDEEEAAIFAALNDPEKRITIPSTDVSVDLTDETLSFEQRRQRRLSKKPNIDHLEDAVAEVLGERDPVTGLMQKQLVPLFDVNDKIIVERYTLSALDEWLDTRVYLVKRIDDETGVVKCMDVEANHWAYVGFKHPGQRFKLCPQKGDPFAAPKLKNAGAGRQSLNGQELPGNDAPAQKKRGRPKGSKNRSKEEIAAEKFARKEGK